MNLGGYSGEYFKDITAALKNTIATDHEKKVLELEDAFERWIDISEKKKKERGIFFFCGNGASATMAEHMSHDCYQNADFLTQTCSETSHITAISNDLSFDDVFSYRISKMLGKNDMLITISSSGNSKNIIKAIKMAKNLGVFTVTVSGMKEDNMSRQLGDLNFFVPLDTYGMVESAHAVLLHCWLDMYMDKYTGGRH